jgi:succinate dehydrogenase / fumarate reductase iron-sulfur subunit
MNVVLNVWRQENAAEKGRFARYEMEDPDPASPLLDVLDLLNERLVSRGERPIAFDSDCREGICGACGVMVNGLPHGGRRLVTTCELSLRDAVATSREGVVTLEPFHTGVFPVVCDLVVDRTALDRVIMAGGFVSVRTGSAPEANAVPVTKEDAERALDAAACIGCGACVAACPNGSAALFAGAKVAHLGRLPQGKLEQGRRALATVQALDEAGFGGCSLHGECERACPKGIHLDVIGRLNRDALRATLGRGER